MNQTQVVRCMLFLVVLAIAALFLGCGQAPVPTTAPTRIIILATPEPSATLTAAPTATPISAATLAPTAVLTPTADLSATPRPTSTRTPVASAGTMQVKIFMIAIGDNGKAGKKIGCDDSVVPVQRTVPATSAVLTAALKELLALHDRNYGTSGLYNALYQSKLSLGSVAITNGRASIQLNGNLLLGGVCDNPRVAAQLQETALQFSTVKQVAVTINGVPLEKVLSEK